MAHSKIVIFEDEFLLANDFKRQIQQFDFEVTAIFRKAEEGLAYLAGVENTPSFPDVILMDITLAGKMNGIEAARIINQKYEVALVFLTGMSQMDIFEEALKTKPVPFLVKPFEIQQAMVSIKLAVYQKNLEVRLRKSQEDPKDGTGELWKDPRKDDFLPA